MKRTVKMVDDRKYIIEEFSSYSELISTNDSRDRNFGDARTDNDNSWRGGTYDEAVEMLRYGWQDENEVKRMKEAVNDKLGKMQDVQKIGFKNDIVGYAPIVPLAIKGVPQNMINSTRKSKKEKIARFVIEISAAGSVSVKEKLKWGAELIANILNLESNGYRVRIEVAKLHCEERYGTVHAVKLLLKSENQPFDIKRMMFPLAHTAMQRRIVWDWYERLPEAMELGGYGTPLHHHSSDSRKKITEQVVGDVQNAHLICCMDDISKVFSNFSAN